MTKDGKGSKGSLKSRRKKHIKSFTAKANVENLHHQQSDKSQQAQDPASATQAAIGLQDAHAAYNGTLTCKSHDDRACSLAEAGFDWSSETHTGGDGVADRNIYQLQQWVYDNSDANITFSEKLEKSKW